MTTKAQRNNRRLFRIKIFGSGVAVTELREYPGLLRQLAGSPGSNECQQINDVDFSVLI